MTSTRFWLLSGLLLLSASTTQAQNNTTVLDRDMKVEDFEDLTYPNVGRSAHVEGVVVVRVELDDQGKVAYATGISGPAALIPDCLTNAKKWKFRPNAEKAAVIVYNFRLTGGISKSGCSHFTLELPNFATVTSCVPQVQ
ncbi:MAG TPA: energy transducer TonB [Candidatus Acidoferrales bacterium]|jgi:outer membrane biosynthesis protein TonB|nr:energy transducer TonB [Candidatus Acidoferrales bacterium]